MVLPIKRNWNRTISFITTIRISTVIMPNITG